jgi:hypothetical protein
VGGYDFGAEAVHLRRHGLRGVVILRREGAGGWVGGGGGGKILPQLLRKVKKARDIAVVTVDVF